MPGSQIVWCGRIKTSKAKIRRARLPKGGGGGEKNGREPVSISLTNLFRPFLSRLDSAVKTVNTSVSYNHSQVSRASISRDANSLCDMCGNLCLRIRYPVRISGFFSSSSYFHPPKRRPEIHLLFAAYEFVNGVCESRTRSFKVLQVLQ